MFIELDWVGSIVSRKVTQLAQRGDEMKKMKRFIRQG